MMKMMIRQL